MKNILQAVTASAVVALVVAAADAAQSAVPSQPKEIASQSTQSVDEGQFIKINGVEQWVTIRGRNRSNPVLVVLSGPGVAWSLMTPFFAPWEDYFTIVQWDQPGAGATQSKNGEARMGPVTLDRIARDGVAVTEFVREHLRVNKVGVLAISGGTIIGLKMVKQRPDLFFAYVGTGQIVNWARQEALSYRMALDQARDAGDQAAIAELKKIGGPPYPDTSADAIRTKYAGALTPAEERVFASLDPAVMAAVRTPPTDATYVARGIPLLDQRAQSMVTYDKLRRELAAFDARALGLTFGVPMLFFQGDRDAYTVTSEVVAYEDAIIAPKKMIVLIEGGGHSAVFLRDRFLTLLVDHVRLLAADTQRVR